MIHVFHGFLGSPEDFKFLIQDNVILHDLYSSDFNPDIKPGDTLIGYSMGGRIAMELANKVNWNINKLVLMNSHPGLDFDDEKESRREWEDSVLKKLKTMTPEKFFDYWNELPIFEFDSPLSPISDERYLASQKLFDQFRLSKQPNFLPVLEDHKDQVLYLVGLFDNKYFTLAEEVIAPYGIQVTPIAGGHRLFQNPQEVKSILTNEGIL
ncbi:alpha/beta fold hydrolase [Peredibacter starrii]|uniref:Alpha/beta fold hydrolase n=1 Tax=Peredibacter starrii TaxID=28202 RepID=A0AAX4HKJ6_9BACT|nr:alpha/beta fold hydrolase [Peredibacter starrii]WPU63760.1 alpha/beta fold hydrolase [Peredibacter starrii]